MKDLQGSSPLRRHGCHRNSTTNTSSHLSGSTGLFLSRIFSVKKRKRKNKECLLYSVGYFGSWNETSPLRAAGQTLYTPFAFGSDTPVTLWKSKDYKTGQNHTPTWLTRKENHERDLEGETSSKYTGIQSTFERRLRQDFSAKGLGELLRPLIWVRSNASTSWINGNKSNNDNEASKGSGCSKGALGVRKLRFVSSTIDGSSCVLRRKSRGERRFPPWAAGITAPSMSALVNPVTLVWIKRSRKRFYTPPGCASSCSFQIGKSKFAYASPSSLFL